MLWREMRFQSFYAIIHLPGALMATSDAGAVGDLAPSQRHPVDAGEDVVRAAVAGHVHLRGEGGASPSRVAGAQLAATVFLGTSSAQPVPGRRNMSSLVITTAAGSGIMVDCGEGTQHQLMRASDIKVPQISAILITHLHGDHCFGLFGLLSTLALNGRTAPLPVLGPIGLNEMVTTVLRLSGAEPPSYPILIHELDATKPHDLVLDLYIGPDSAERVLLHASPLTHGMKTLGYVVSELARPRRLDADKAKALGASGHALGRLKQGEDVQLADGTSICALDVLHPPPARRAVCILQDTMESAEAEQYLAGPDFPCELALLIHECTFDDSLHDLALTRGHSTSRMAGAFAARVRAQTLALTHFSTRYRQPSVDDLVVFGRKHDSATPAPRGAQVHASVAAVEPAAKREGADRPAPSGADLPAPCKTQRGRDSHSKSPSDLGQEALDAARDVLRAHAHGGCAREAHDLCVV